MQKRIWKDCNQQLVNRECAAGAQSGRFLSWTKTLYLKAAWLMKVWPFGIGFQEQVSNHSKLLHLRGVVVSVGVKRQESILGRYRSERRVNPNHCWRVVIQWMVSKPGAFPYPGINLQETWLLCRWHPAYRWRESDLGSRAELREPVILMLREKSECIPA